MSLITLYIILHISSSPYSKEYTASVNSDLEILRDEYAIPHIRSTYNKNLQDTATDSDVFLGLGFVHAQDRMWQMEFRRRLVKGRLAEIFGDIAISQNTSLADIDHIFRSLDLYKYASASISHLSEQSQHILTSYTKGINLWLSNLDNSILKLHSPLELYLVPTELEPWTVEDSLVAMKLLGLDLSRSFVTKELNILRFLSHIDAKQVADIFLTPKEKTNISIPDLQSLWDGNYKSYEYLDSHDSRSLNNSWLPYLNDGASGASNAWAVSPLLSTTGGALLASEPHLTLTTPTIWYVAHLELHNGNVIGATIPGIPLIICGRNDKIAWGLTHLPSDTIDFRLEMIHPLLSNKYLTSEGWDNIYEENIVIKIHNSSEQHVKIKRTKNGPIIPSRYLHMDNIIPSNHELSMQWAGFFEKDLSFEGALELMFSHTTKDASISVRKIATPTLNIVIADRNTVAMKRVGRIPIRHDKNTYHGIVPTPGWIPKYDWKGFIPGDALDSYFKETSSNYVISANHDLTLDHENTALSNEWQGMYRAKRLNSLITNNTQHSAYTFQSIQNDNISVMAKEFFKILDTNKLWPYDTENTTLSENNIFYKAQRQLIEWDGNMSSHKIQPLIFYAWRKELLLGIAEDELGELVSGIHDTHSHFIIRVLSNDNGSAYWCDNVQTLNIENCTTVVKSSFHKAIQWLVATYGDDMEKWKWKNAHISKNIHIPFGIDKNNLLSWFVNVSYPTDGGNHTINYRRVSNNDETPFDNRHGGSYRAIYDLQTPSISKFAISTGQSGNVLSKYYDNFAEIWRLGKYIPLTTDYEDFSVNNIGIINIVPDTTDKR